MKYKELADKIFEQGKDRFEDMEVYVEKTKAIEIAVFNGEIDKYNISDTEGLSLRGIYDDKMGYSYTEKVDESSIEMLIEEAYENGKHIDALEKEIIFSGSDEYKELDNFSKELHETPLEDKIEFTKEMNGDISIDDISFSYGTRTDVFENFSLKIPKGKVTAIIGESGSGKTTIAALLQKLYPIKKGKIFIGSHNIDYYDNSSLRAVIAAVPQQLDIFSGNIIENIALGDLSPDMQHIIEICTELGIIPFIEKLPAGFNTTLGEHGIGLSGGEKQRLAIARALYRKPEILILDEATSSLDSQSEHFVQETIQNFNQKDKTVILRLLDDY